MKLDLSQIIEMPGKSISFLTDLDVERLSAPSIKSFTAPPHAEGRVSNTAGVLTLTGTIHADMVCICDRCGKEFSLRKELPVEAKIAADESDETDPDIFPLEGDTLDVSDVLETLFILETESKFLCREDCKGLCPSCGKDLSDGPCGCKKEVDPRLAALSQLLDNKDK